MYSRLWTGQAIQIPADVFIVKIYREFEEKKPFII